MKRKSRYAKNIKTFLFPKIRLKGKANKYFLYKLLEICYMSIILQIVLNIHKSRCFDCNILLFKILLFPGQYKKYIFLCHKYDIQHNDIPLGDKTEITPESWDKYNFYSTKIIVK